MTPRARALLLPAIALLAGAIYLWSSMRVDRDFAAFLPHGADATQRLVMQQLRDSPAARLVLIRLRGADPQTLAATSEALREALAADGHFDYVTNGSLAGALRDLPSLAAARYVLSPDAASHMSVEGLHSALQRRLAALSGSMGMLEKRFLASDPTAETEALIASLQAGGAPRREAGVWFDAQGSSAMLVARTRAAASDQAAQQAAMQALDAALQRVRTQPGIAADYSSAGFLGVRSALLIAHDAARVSWMAVAGIVVMLLFAYRSPSVVLLCATPALAGLVAGLCVLTAMFGSVHAITLAFGTTLIGEAVDYPSYVLTRLSAGRSIADVQAVVRRPLLLAVLTTACGAFAFLGSGVDGLIELGVLTSCGIVVAGALAWWLVPRLVPPGWHFAAFAMPGSVALGPAGAWPAVGAAPRALAAIAVTLVLVVSAAGKPAWNDDPARMSPLPADAIALDRVLREATGAPDVSRFALVRGSSREQVLQAVEQMQPVLDAAIAAQHLGGYDSVGRYLPSEATQRTRRDALPDDTTLQHRLSLALPGLPFRAEAFAPFLRDVALARSAAPLDPAAFAGTGLGLRVASLLGSDPDGYWSVIPLRGVRDAQALADQVRATSAAATLIDLRQQTSAMFAQFRARTFAAIVAGASAIVLILAIGLRSLRAAAAAIAPSLLGATWTAAGVIAFGGGLSIFHLIALMLVLGIGVNYALFVQRAASRGDSLPELCVMLAVVSGTTCLAFGAMATSGIPVLRAIGLTVVAGTVATLAACALVFAPGAGSAPVPAAGRGS